MEEIKPGTLYIVATPIGNISEITFRALEILKGVDLIACEDTRHSLKLLNHYDIKKPLAAYHKHNERVQSQTLIQKLRDGQSIALISDAGMPGISDPGNILIKDAAESGVNITVVSGASALINALVLSGMDTERFSFVGFLPENKKDREVLIKDYVNLPSTLVLYSSPHNLEKDLAFLYSHLGARKAAIVKELTKIHESVVHTTLGEGVPFEPRGEFVLVIEGGKRAGNPLNALAILEHIAHYTEQGIEKKEAIKKVAADRNLPKNEIYKYTIKE